MVLDHIQSNENCLICLHHRSYGYLTKEVTKDVQLIFDLSLLIRLFADKHIRILPVFRESNGI